MEEKVLFLRVVMSVTSDTADPVELAIEVVRCCPKVVTTPEIFSNNLTLLGFPGESVYSIPNSAPEFRLGYAMASRHTGDFGIWKDLVLSFVQILVTMKVTPEFVRAMAKEKITCPYLVLCADFAIRHRLYLDSISRLIRNTTPEERLSLKDWFSWVEKECSELNLTPADLGENLGLFEEDTTVKKMFDLVRSSGNLSEIWFLAQVIPENVTRRMEIVQALIRMKPHPEMPIGSIIKVACTAHTNSQYIIMYVDCMMGLWNKYRFDLIPEVVRKIYQASRIDLDKIISECSRVFRANQDKLKELSVQVLADLILDGIFL